MASSNKNIKVAPKQREIYLLHIQTRNDYYTGVNFSVVLSATSLRGLAKSFEIYCRENRHKETNLDDEDIEEAISMTKKNILEGKEYNPEFEIAYTTSLNTSELFR